MAAGSAMAGIAAAVGGAFAGLYGGRMLKKKCDGPGLKSGSFDLG